MNHDELLALMAPESPYARARDARKVVYGLISMAFSEMDDEQSKQHPQPAYTPRAPEPRENIGLYLYISCSVDTNTISERRYILEH